MHVIAVTTILAPLCIRRVLYRGGFGRFRFGLLPLCSLNAGAGLGSGTYDDRLYGALLDGDPRPHFGTRRPCHAVAVGPRWSGLGRVLVLVREPRPRGPQGVRGYTVSADAPDSVVAHNL